MNIQDENRIPEKRILALDGGGIKGTIQASFLAALERTTGKRVIDYFDLIVGTSTGGIIALGLGLGLPAEHLLEFYRTRGPEIFGESGRSHGALNDFWAALTRPLRWLRQLTRPKYSSRPLRSALEEAFAEAKLGDCRTRVVIPSFSSHTRSVYVFKTAHHERLRTDWQERIVDVALSTSAAPTYFTEHHLRSGVRLIDGGIWANNPVGLAVVEAIGVLKWPAEALRVLSVGCSDTPKNLPEAPGKIKLAPYVADLFMMGQAHGSLGTAKLLLGDERRLLRVQPTVPPGELSLDSFMKIPQMEGLGACLARNYLPRVNEVFFTTPREEFVPIYTASRASSHK